jgi:hypothetical protein
VGEQKKKEERNGYGKAALYYLRYMQHELNVIWWNYLKAGGINNGS